jgi:predicted hydrocarbon binding protein
MEETHADATALLKLGESLARSAEAADMPAFARAYAEMGLGVIETTAANEGHYEFTGTDLFEKTPGSRATTCYLALGYATGAVSRLHADAPTKGAEVSCESRGDARCRFVVHVK